ncbi:MAG: hypothetical protein ACF8XB_09960 [Planctomycetota bacterium JB042]
MTPPVSRALVLGFLVALPIDALGSDPASRPGVGPSVQTPGGPGTTIPVSAQAVIDFEDLGVPPGGTSHPLDFACVTSAGFDFCPGPQNTFNDLHIGNGYSGYGYNGTTVVTTHNDLIMRRTDGAPFALSQFDLSGFPGGQELPFSVTAMPSGVSMTFTPDNVVDGGGGAPDFETFNLPSSFVGTSFVFLTTGISSLDAIFGVDNLCVGPPCAIQYGVGCPGTGGFAPELAQTVCDSNGQVAFELSGAHGGATALLLFGLTQAATPIGPSGCFLNVGTLLPIQLTIPLGGAGPGNGSAFLPGILPPSASGLSFTMTFLASDAATPLGFTTANGIEVKAP